MFKTYVYIKFMFKTYIRNKTCVQNSCSKLNLCSKLIFKAASVNFDKWWIKP